LGAEKSRSRASVGESRGSCAWDIDGANSIAAAITATAVRLNTATNKPEDSCAVDRIEFLNVMLQSPIRFVSSTFEDIMMNITKIVMLLTVRAVRIVDLFARLS
jgi:hypothetical protein